MDKKPVLFPRRLCETLSGNLAHTIGRLAFRHGRPMLVEHVGGVYLEHDLEGRVITPGYGAGYGIVHVWNEDQSPSSSGATTGVSELAGAAGVASDENSSGFGAASGFLQSMTQTS